MRERDEWDVAFDLLGSPGRMLSGSKQAAPERRVVWNANVLVGKYKVWYGDISLTESGDKLQELAEETMQTVFVLREMDARFDNENNPKIENAVEIYEPVNA